jgi:hypothetical protein
MCKVERRCTCPKDFHLLLILLSKFPSYSHVSCILLIYPTAAIAAAPPFQQNLWAAGTWANAILASTSITAAPGGHPVDGQAEQQPQSSCVCIVDPSIGAEPVSDACISLVLLRESLQPLPNF